MRFAHCGRKKWWDAQGLNKIFSDVEFEIVVREVFFKHGATAEILKVCI